MAGGVLPEAIRSKSQASSAISAEGLKLLKKQRYRCVRDVLARQLLPSGGREWARFADPARQHLPCAGK
jgi:hypothetical protein